MKLPSRSLLAAGCFAVAAFGVTACHLIKHESGEEKEPAVIGSIRPAGKLTPAELSALAKITLPYAMNIALTTVPGTVITAELEVEDGNLQYSFDIVGADKSVTEVEIDAGNGKVLGTDKEGAAGADKD